MDNSAANPLWRFVSMGVIGALVGLGLITPPATATLLAGETCFATLDNGLTLYASNTAQAVQEAVNAAASGSLIKIAGYCPGVQAQGGSTQTLLIAKNLTLAGGYTVTDWSTYNPVGNLTTLDAQGLGRVISITAGTPVALQGFTVTNGKIEAETGVHGAGIYAGGDLALTHMTVFSNTLEQYIAGPGPWDGGGAYVVGQSVIAYTTFSRNRARYGGGGYFIGPATIVDSTFNGNGVVSYPDLGSGGGAFFENTVTLNRTTFSQNGASEYGGGAIFGGTTHVADTVFNGNSSFRGYGGGALFTDITTLTNTTFSNNGTGSIGGGAYFSGPTIAQGLTFSNNNAYRGGGAYFSDVANITRATFVYNRADNGGGVYFSNTSAQLTNVLFARNVASEQGEALFAHNVQPLVVLHTTIVSPTLNTGAALFMTAGTAYFTNTIVASHTVALETSSGVVHENYNLFEGVSTLYSGTVVSGGYSFTGTAAFSNPSLGDYHLGVGSAALDAGGNAGVGADFDGNPRPLGNGYDIGYDERIAYSHDWYMPLVGK